MLKVISIPLVISGIFAVICIFLQWRKFYLNKNANLFFKSILNSFTWGFVAFFSFNPHLAMEISEMLGFGKTLNTLIFLGFILIFWLLNKIFYTLNKQRDTQTKIIRFLALQEAKLKYEIKN